MRLLSKPVLFLLLACALAQTPETKLKLTGDGIKVVQVDQVVVVKVNQTVATSFPFYVEAPSGAGLYFWKYPDAAQAEDQGDKLKVTGAPKGLLTVSVKAISPKLDKDGKFIGFLTTFDSITVNVGAVPDPLPPDPKPVPPSPAPFPVNGLAALIVYESSEISKHPGLSDVMSGSKTNDYMAAKGIKGGFLKLDKDSDVSGLDAWVKEAWKVPRPSLPWLVISNGEAGYSGPVPKDTQGVHLPSLTVELLRKYGG